MFQYGVEFWLSDRVSNMLKNATTLAQESYEQSLSRWKEEAVATSQDLATNFPSLSATSDANTLRKRLDTLGIEIEGD